MILQIPSARESISLLGPFTSREVAKMGILPMAVQTMGLSLMTEQTRIGREARRTAVVVGTDKGLQVGIQVLAGEGGDG